MARDDRGTRDDPTRQVSVAREVAARPEAVWALVSDVTRMGDWSPETTRGAWLGSASGPAVGAEFRGWNELGRLRWSTRCRVVECEPGRRFAFDVVLGRARSATWGYRIEPSEGGCTVTEYWVDHRSGTVRWLAGLVTGVRDRASHTRAGMATTLDRLAAAAEADPTTPPSPSPSPSPSSA